MNDTRKTAIMTWYTYQNYGSALQASALYHTVQTMGYDPMFVQYPPQQPLTDTSKLHLFQRGISKLKYILNRPYNSAERSRLFTEYLSERTSESNLCVSYTELYDLNDQCGAFLCGSDQIWSPICFDPHYFLPFVSDRNKMVAYAPSFGSTKIDNPLIREKTAALLSRFKHLAVREQQGADLIKNLTGQDATVVLDPTLLMDAAEWDAYAQVEETPKLPCEHYIVCYFLGDPNNYMDYVRALSQKMNVPYYVIPVKVKENRNSHAVPFEVGPREFVSLVKNAAYVCTDSFHGMAFSINYGVPFSVFKRFKDNDPKNQNSRIFNLLQKFGLEERLEDPHNKGGLKRLPFTCDFSEAHQRLAEERRLSMGYLKNALESAFSSQEDTTASPFTITDTCCGCGACATVCPKKAISIVQDEAGFQHYTIDETTCIRCGQCKTVCPMIRLSAPHIKDSPALYAVKSTSDNVLKTSSSGGIGYELASYLMDEGYAVCGCTYDADENRAKHIRLAPDQKDKLSLLQGSKYIQSVSAPALAHIVDKATERPLVFFGTPCQAAGVDKLLRKKGLRDKAVIVDLICHGVPSQHLWDKFLATINKTHQTGEHPAVSFRTKEVEWRKMVMSVKGNGNRYEKEETVDDFYAFFRRGLCYMDSCYGCPYREHSAADIRIGDYWGPRFQTDKQGVSMVIANTDVGDRLLHALKNNGICHVEPQDLSEYWSVQFPYNHLKPLAWDSLIEELKTETADLASIRKTYCAYYDKKERLNQFAHRLKKLIKRG